MNETHIAELQRTIENAQAGQWMPATIVAGFLGLIIVLLLYIYRKEQNISSSRHKDAEQQLKILTEIATELKADKVVKDRELKEIKQDVRDNRIDIKNLN